MITYRRGGIADAIDLLNGSLGGSTLIFFNNTTTDTTMGISIMNMYGQSTSATPDIPASSMVVYPIAGAIRNIALFGNSVIGSNIYVANAVCQSGVTTEIPINQAYIGGDTANISINVII